MNKNRVLCLQILMTENGSSGLFLVVLQTVEAVEKTAGQPVSIKRLQKLHLALLRRNGNIPCLVAVPWSVRGGQR